MNDDDSGPIDIEKLRRKIIRQRNLAVGFLLGLMVLLFFAITVVKMKNPKMPAKPAPVVTSTNHGL